MLTWDTKRLFSNTSQSKEPPIYFYRLNNYEAWGASADITGKKKINAWSAPQSIIIHADES